MKLKLSLSLSLSCLFLASGGCGGSGDDLCAQAARHLDSCLGTSTPLPDTCDPERARRILSADCSQFDGDGTRSTSLFGFDFWSWLLGDDEGGTPPDEKPDNHQGNQYCNCGPYCYPNCCSNCGTGGVSYGFRCSTIRGICPLYIPKQIGSACHCPDLQANGTTIK